MKTILLVSILGLLNLSYFKASAQGDLLIFPKRIVFEQGKNSEQILLNNTGSDSATYVVSFTQMRMKPDGSLENIVNPDSGQYFSDKNIRVFPRTITLAPQESQYIKVQAVRLGELSPNEYRSHLLLRAIPRDKFETTDSTKQQDTTVSVTLKPVYGFTIPMIIRQGDISAETTISGLTLQKETDSTALINFYLNRSGKASVFGDIELIHTDEKGKTHVLQTIKGISVYTPNTSRKLSVKVKTYEGIGYERGKIQVNYTNQVGTVTSTIASQSFPLVDQAITIGK